MPQPCDGSMATAWVIPVIVYVSTATAPELSAYSACAAPLTVSVFVGVELAPVRLVHCATSAGWFAGA